MKRFEKDKSPRFERKNEQSHRKYSSRPRSGIRKRYDDDDRDEMTVRPKRAARPEKASFHKEYRKPDDSFDEEQKVRNGFFDTMVLTLAHVKGVPVIPDFSSPDPLAVLDYSTELKFKLDAIRTFWKEHRLPGTIRTIIPSPRPRNYRTTSKRKVMFERGKLVFSMGYGEHAKGENVLVSPLEAELHGQTYTKLYEYLSRKEYLPLSKSLNYLVIRGSYEKAAVVLNVFQLHSGIMRKAKLLAEHVQKELPAVTSMFLLLDESRSPYYLESMRPGKGFSMKKLYGFESMDVTVDDQKLFYPPTAFSQINESMLKNFTATAFKLLMPGNKDRLVDLYCGYGLFSMIGAEKAGPVIGIDLDRGAISAAEANAAHLHPDKNIRFTSAAVTADAIHKHLPDDLKNEYVLLDPPRSGTVHGVIEAIAARGPEQVLHVFCGTDRIPKELPVWRGAGYQVAGIKVFDMFPGSVNLETMILLEPVRR